MSKKKREDGPDRIYRKIYIKMHADDRFRRLSKPQASGQALWWHLIAGEQTDIIPGLMKIGESAFAEMLGWTLKGFREAYQEVYQQGLVKADWEARLVWVPNALKYNLPQSPKVIVGWAKAWPYLPECDLKLEAYLHIEEELKGYHQAFLKAFREKCGKPIRKANGYQKAENREQIAEMIDSPPFPLLEKEEARVPKKFVRPTLEEIRAYCTERGNDVDPAKWFDHYEANGWKVGRNAMKDWQAAVRKWEKNDFAPKPAEQKQTMPRPLTDAEVEAYNRGERNFS